MQRLVRRLSRGTDASAERGATSTVVALLMVPLLGFAALSLDVAGMWATRQQLQTGADAGALAIARDCGKGACGSPAATAQSFATANLRAGTASATATTTSSTVTVATSSVRQHIFAPVLGRQQDTISARAKAAWGAPSGGVSILPLAFSWCEWKAQTGGGMPSSTTSYTIKFTKTSGTTCTGPSGNVVPGGFGWISSSSCKVTSTIGNVLYSDTGASVPSGCSTSDFTAVQNKTVLLPLFDNTGDSGSNAWYRVYGYAAFTVTGYDFVGQYSWNKPAGCGGSERCIAGYFTRFVTISEAFDYSASAPQLGAAVVSLVP
jgi:Flp pilus assembly protein TadG